VGLKDLELHGQVAIVTGAGRGVGRGIASILAEAGATVICSARSRNEIEDTADAIRAAGGKAHVQVADVTKRHDLEALAKETMSRHGRIDILVNNAGGADFIPFLETTEEQFRYHFDWNTTSAFLMSQAVTPFMAAAGRGSIVNVSSGAARIGIRGMVAYSVAKAGLEQLTRGLAQELAPKIRVNCVSLGAIMTPALQRTFDMAPGLREGMHALTPLRTHGKPEGVGLGVLYFCSKDCYATGSILQIDGGIQDTNMPIRLPDL